MSDHREAIAEVLGAHFPEASQYGPGYCACSPRTGNWVLWTGDHAAGALLGSDVLAQIRAEARAEALREVEALAEEATERAYFGIALEKMLTIQTTGPDRAKVPPHWRESAEFAAIVHVADLRAALTPEGSV